MLNSYSLVLLTLSTKNNKLVSNLYLLMSIFQIHFRKAMMQGSDPLKCGFGKGSCNSVGIMGAAD
jgi:hypothetical protein